MNHNFAPFLPIPCISKARRSVALQVTKRRASNKPSYDNLRRSLEDMKSQCQRDGVTRVSMPRYVSSSPNVNVAAPVPVSTASLSTPLPPPPSPLRLSRSIGCGLDRLNWDQVSSILEQVFGDSGISITVYSLPERAETKVMNENRRR